MIGTNLIILLMLSGLYVDEMGRHRSLDFVHAHAVSPIFPVTTQEISNLFSI